MAAFRVRSASLRGVEVPAERAPSMIDEYPVLAVAAAFAEGATVMRGLKELRVKEIRPPRRDGGNAAVNGVERRDRRRRPHRPRPRPCPAGGGLVATHMDHRIAMSALVMGLAADRPVTDRRRRLHRDELSGLRRHDAFAGRGFVVTC